MVGWTSELVGKLAIVRSTVASQSGWAHSQSNVLTMVAGSRGKPRLCLVLRDDGVVRLAEKGASFPNGPRCGSRSDSVGEEDLDVGENLVERRLGVDREHCGAQVIGLLADRTCHPQRELDVVR